MQTQTLTCLVTLCVRVCVCVLSTGKKLLMIQEATNAPDRTSNQSRISYPLNLIIVQYSTFIQYKALDQLYNLKAPVVDECNPIHGNKEQCFLPLKHFRVEVTRTVALHSLYLRTVRSRTLQVRLLIRTTHYYPGRI